MTKTNATSTNQKLLDAYKPIVNSKVLRKFIVEWIVDRRHAFNVIEAGHFLELSSMLMLQCSTNYQFREISSVAQ